MSQTRRLRRESGRLQAQQRLRRSQAAARKRPGRRLRHWRDIPGLLFQRKTLAVIAALALAAIIAVPVFAPGATPTTPTPDVEPTTEATPTPPNRQYSQAPITPLSPQSTFNGQIRTNRGAVGFALSHVAAPDAATNFQFLSRERFYDTARVLKVEPGKWVEIGGSQADGASSPGYSVPLTANREAPRVGSLVVLDRGEGMNSEFAILLTDNPPSDLTVHPFGRVTDGLDIVRQLQVGDRISSVRVAEIEPPEPASSP